MNSVQLSSLQIPTQSLMAAFTKLQAIPMKAALTENQNLTQKLIQLAVALRVQAPELGRYVNIYG